MLEKILKNRFMVLVCLLLLSAGIRLLDVSRELELLRSIASGSYVEKRPMDGLADTLGAFMSLAAIGINILVNLATFAWAWRMWEALRWVVVLSTRTGILLRLIDLAFEGLRIVYYLTQPYSVIDFDHPRQMETLVYLTESSLQIAISIGVLRLYRTELLGNWKGVQILNNPGGIAAPRA